MKTLLNFLISNVYFLLTIYTISKNTVFFSYKLISDSTYSYMLVYFLIPIFLISSSV